jgi:hypothetical protein
VAIYGRVNREVNMLHIKILGPGCVNCYELEQTAAASLEELLEEDPDLEATLEHIENPVEFQKYPILFTPGLVVNERLVCAGRVPSKDEVTGWLRSALNQKG